MTVLGCSTTATAVGVTLANGDVTACRSGEIRTTAATSATNTAAIPMAIPREDRGFGCGAAGTAWPTAIVGEKTASVLPAARARSRCTAGAGGTFGSARAAGGVSVAAVT